MSPIVSTAVLVLVSTITPGPNNYFMLRLGARHGLLATMPAALGVTLGGLTMLGLAVTGIAPLAERLSWARIGIAVAGCLWLALSALWLMLGRGGAAGTRPAPSAAHLLKLFGFQFINPKAWMLVLAVAAAVPASDGADAHLLMAFALFTAIPFAALLLWAAVGAVLLEHLNVPSRRVRFDQVTGALLMVSALALLWSAVASGAPR